MEIERLIVLDDDPLYVEMFSDFSKHLNIEYKGVATSHALFEIDLKPSDLILLDVYLTGEDGLDTITALESQGYEGYLSLMSGASDNVLTPLYCYIESLQIKQLPRLNKPARFKEVITLLGTEPKELINQTSPSLGIENSQIQLDSRTLNEWFKKEYIFPVFQPQVCITTNKIIGIECLVRVKHPDINSLQPLTFINLLETANLISEYTLLMLDCALHKLSQLLINNSNLSCSFNVSALSLTEQFADSFLLKITQHNIPPKQVIIELTESSAVNMNKEALYAISRLKVSEFPLSIDDFGTGYSSIRQLVDLPFDELKIDRSFIVDVKENIKSQAILNATIGLAKSLNYRLVVEGVETQEQINFFKDKGNLVIQGYYNFKPLEFNELNKLF